MNDTEQQGEIPGMEAPAARLIPIEIKYVDSKKVNKLKGKISFDVEMLADSDIDIEEVIAHISMMLNGNNTIAGKSVILTVCDPKVKFNRHK